MNTIDVLIGRRFAHAVIVCALAACAGWPGVLMAKDPQYDTVIRGGTIYDGSEGAPTVDDIAIEADRIAAIGHLGHAKGRTEVDAHGLAVAPGFINMLSQAGSALVVDGRGQSDIRQGVTLEVLGEGFSGGPLNERMKAQMKAEQGDLKFAIAWTTLGSYFEYLEKKGVSPNFASFIGAATAREYVLGDEGRAPTADELRRMQELVRGAMRDGAVGVASALIYAPGYYAKTAELVALGKAAGEFGGMYASHLRSEGNALLEGIDELVSIARAAGVRAEIYHFKQSGKPNWNKIEAAIGKVNAARAAGLEITADLYLYPASSTGLRDSLPPWARGADARKLHDASTRARIIRDMRTPTDKWSQLAALAGAGNILLVGFKTDALKPLTGMTLAEVARRRGTSPEETIMDLVSEDHSRIMAVYFTISEENIRREIPLPWMSFCSDGAAVTNEGVFLKSSIHPRAYGNFARLLGRYVRDDKLISLQEAIRRLTSLPAHTLRIRDRGLLEVGYFADVVVFDPATISDHATFQKPHRYATGVQHVFVNGVQVLRNGEHTGATPGRVVRGPGWTGWTVQDGSRPRGGAAR